MLEKDLNELPSGLNGLLQWVCEHKLCCVLDGSAAGDPEYAFPGLIAVGSRRSYEFSPGQTLESLDEFLTPSELGYVVQVGYSLKDSIEKVGSRHIDPIGFPSLFIFEPSVLIRLLPGGMIRIQADDPEATWGSICDRLSVPSSLSVPTIDFQARCTKGDYVSDLDQIRSHIRRGDCYELNYCQEFFAESVSIDPLDTYLRLHSVAQAPFSCLYRIGDRWLMGASPERFLKKTGDRLESRPMKGTAPRSADPFADDELAEGLSNSVKDRSENIMVVDLVRNDLSRVAARGSVVVEGLCERHSFQQVHQLVSTVSCRTRTGVGLREILEACFPMGSMTGAPKVKVMELTDRYERSARGLYSGSVGFMEPNGDFDLNVVIRSLQYRSDTGYLSYHVGSGVTIYSDPEKEWEECLWKSAGIRKLFGA